MKQSNISEGYKNSPLGIIPNEWKVERLGISYKIQGGFAFKSELFTNQGIAIIRISNISVNRDVDLSDCVFYPFTEFVGTPFEVKSGDILIALSGATTGKSAMYRLNTIAYLNQRVGLFLQISPAINKLFLFYWIDSNTFQNQLNLLLIAGAQPNISPKDLENIKIIIPPLNEQQKIAEVLSIWDKAIEKQTLLVEKLELRKKGLMQQLLTGKKRLHGFNGVAWKKVKLDEVTTFLSNNSLSRDNLNTLRGSILNIHYGDVLIKLPTIVNVSLVDLPFINEELNIVSKDFVSEGDIIMADTAEDGTVGKACEVVNVGNNKVVSGLHTILIHPTIAFAPMFLGYYLNSKEYHKQILSIMQGIKVYSITKDALRKTNIKIPPLEEQNAIAEILSVCDNEITLAKQKLDTLRLQKKGLMQVLLTGKKRVEL